jgi:transglutaminase-like putative cysteine protease
MLYRRTLLQAAAAAFCLPAMAQQRRFEPQPGDWRTFEITTRIDLLIPQGASSVWVPLPSVESEWQRSMETSFSTNGRAVRTADRQDGAKMLHVEFDPATAQPFVEVVNRVQTRGRSAGEARRAEPAGDLGYWLRPTSLIPTDGIVRETARKATGNARTDEEKVRRIYDWVVTNSWREPTVRGCGEGDIKTMLETGNLGGKCADINALFVGLCRASGVPARDVYGLRLAPSAFGYKELSGNSASLKSAQHCRAEAHVRGKGWVAMDPADVAKVMRQETPDWIKTVDHPVVAPVYKGLYGGWEGNWVAYNTAHDVALPGARHGKLGFLMYPVGEDAKGRLDSYSPDDFKYQITAREIRA